MHVFSELVMRNSCENITNYITAPMDVVTYNLLKVSMSNTVLINLKDFYAKCMNYAILLFMDTWDRDMVCYSGI